MICFSEFGCCSTSREKEKKNNETKMAPPQRMRVANEKASKYITMRGNVPKSSVRLLQYNKSENDSKSFTIGRKKKL